MQRRHAAALAALLVLAPGCGLFRPTEPEPPSGGVVQTDYSDPDATIGTLARAIGDKGATTGASAYLDGLASTARDGVEFNAIHLPSVVQALQGTVTIPNPWTHALESSFYQRLIDIDDAAYQMTWEKDQRFSGQDIDNPDDAVRNQIYTVVSESGIIAKGYAKLSFIRSENNRWVITVWEDRDLEPGDDLNLTFSMLRLKP